MVRRSSSLGRPFRAVILALIVHVGFIVLFGVSLQLEPNAVQANQARPIKVAVIDLAVIEREENRKAEQEKQRKEEVRRQAEKKKVDRLEAKRQADLKLRQETERKRKTEEKKKKEVAAKRKLEEKKKAELKLQAEEKKKKEAELRRQTEEKKKKEAELRRQAEEKKKKEAELRRQTEEKKKKEAKERKKREAEAERKAEEKRKREIDEKRKAEEKKKREAEEIRRQDKQAADSALGALVGEIRNKVTLNWTNSRQCAGLEIEIKVKVTRDGEVTSANVVRGSGDPVCDRSAENAVRKASPLPFPDNPRYYEFIKENVFKFKPPD